MATRMGFVPYVHAGLRARQGRRRRFERDPKVEGLILDKHGIFTFGDKRARSLRAHDRDGHARAKTRLQKNRKAVFVSAQLPQQVPPHDDVAPIRARRVQPARTPAAKARSGG